MIKVSVQTKAGVLTKANALSEVLGNERLRASSRDRGNPFSRAKEDRKGIAEGPAKLGLGQEAIDLGRLTGVPQAAMVAGMVAAAVPVAGNALRPGRKTNSDRMHLGAVAGSRTISA